MLTRRRRAQVQLLTGAARHAFELVARVLEHSSAALAFRATTSMAVQDGRLDTHFIAAVSLVLHSLSLGGRYRGALTALWRPPEYSAPRRLEAPAKCG